jgi:molybdopterin-guanine dinucleotide biosynthesis protein A
MDRTQITGLVLAGGLGRRMGGVDKGLELLRGKPLAERVVERLGPQVGVLLVNANQNIDAYAQFGRVVSDCIGGFAGPLAGLHAGLSACSTPLLASVPCDAPFLPLDLVERLHDGLERVQAEAAVARAGGRMQPVFALLRRDVLTSLGDFLAGGGSSVSAWLGSLATATVDFADADAFANVNTREELNRLGASPTDATRGGKQS